MNNEIIIKQLFSFKEMKDNFHLVKLLTPSLTQDAYNNHLKSMLNNNYFQVVALLNNQVIGLSGFWIATKFYCGKYLEVDNFIVHPEFRKQGVGELLMNWMLEKAKSEACQTIMLDAYLENKSAHHFYKKFELEARGYHFLKKIN